MKLDINALKEKIMELIPFGKKGEVEVDVEETPEGEEVDVEVKVKEGEEEESEEEEDEEEEDDEEAAAKKKKGLYIKVAAGIVVAFFALDEMTKDTEEAPKKAPVKKTRAKKKKAKQPKKAPKKKVAEKKKVEAPKPPPEKVKAIQPPAVVKEEKPVKRDISSVPPTPPPPPPPKAEKEPAELALEVEEIVEEIGTPTEEELKGPAEYVAPPDYSEVGRGLVYNCKGKHWACVDKNSFFACRDNLKWAKENGKGFECFTKDVYRNERDCRIIQTHFINTNLKTDFCK